MYTFQNLLRCLNLHEIKGFDNKIKKSALTEQECQNEFLKNTDLNIEKVLENKVELSDGEFWTFLFEIPDDSLKVLTEILTTRDSVH